MWKLPEPPPWLQRSWPHVRTALIFAHVAAIFVMCLPAPYKMAGKSAWRTPQAKSEVANWAKRLRGIGIDLTPEQLEAKMLGITRSYLKFRRSLNRPFDRYHRLSEMRQGWSMFIHPQTHPGWLHVDIRSGSAAFEPVYVQHSDEHTWRRRQFDDNRLRKLLGRIARRPVGHPAYIQLANWIARKAAADFPQASHVRVRHFRSRTLKPGRGKVEGRFVSQRVYRLDKYR